MKQMIVLISTIVLGVFIYQLVAGPGDDSIMSGLSALWQSGLDQRSLYGA